MSGISAFDIVTLVVAIIGVVLALASLVWQAATFVLSGSRVKVELHRGMTRRQPAQGIARALGPPEPTPSELGGLRAQGFEDEVAGVDVRNVGRLAVSVEEVTLFADDGWGFAVLADPENQTLPHRLEPGAAATWHIPIEGLQRLVESDGKTRSLSMHVKLGTGQTVRTKEQSRLVPQHTK
jgi:hypothetical protein